MDEIALLVCLLISLLVNVVIVWAVFNSSGNIFAVEDEGGVCEHKI